MRRPLTISLGIGGIAVAALSLLLYAYIVTRPYRLSVKQAEVLPWAMNMQGYSSLVALVLGVTAHLAGRRLTAPRLTCGRIAIVAATTALLLGLLTPHFHSVSRKLTDMTTPNHSIQRTEASRFAQSLSVAQWRLAPAADADR
jgi:hypothetical protein